MEFEPFITALARGFELAGVLALLIGAFIAGFVCLRRMWAGMSFQEAYGALRADLGRAILLGLELLVIADIIGTVAIEPTLHNLSVLAVIVLIRTFLSFALELEVSGRWPWQQSPERIRTRQGDAGPNPGSA